MLPETSARQAIAEAAARLSPVSDTARLDAELLMAHAMGCSRDDLILRHMDAAAPDSFAGLIERRMAHEPVAYLIGRRDFWTIELEVGPGVLIPRPDSETLIEAAISHFSDRVPPRRILDLGTGPGTLLLAALDQWPDAGGLGIDQSEVALGYARRNASALRMNARAIFQQGDWARGLNSKFDLILCNPPYIGTGEPLPDDVRDHEPGEALFAGPDGLNDYRRIIPQLKPLMTGNSVAILEIGWTQADAVSALGKAQGFDVALFHDLGNRPRAIVLS